MPIIETERLTKRFGNVTAVNNLDLTIHEGEVFGFLGPNGSGKSTTINMLLDFIRPTTGNISVLGHDPQTESRAVRERVGLLPEGYSLYDRLSAREHIEFAIEMEESDDDPKEILERVGLASDADRTVGGFSKGMGRRLALGIAFVGNPDLLILDEPSSGLDPTASRELREIILEEAESGTTVFFSSHLLEQVEAVCDQIGIMRDGDLVTVDTIEGLRESTDSDFTITLTVDKIPESHRLSSLDGVTNITTNGSKLHISCSDPNMKTTAISHVEKTGATVTDINIEETSLEDLFTEYTSDKGEVEA